MITLPRDWRIYHSSITERSRDLIDLGIWAGINITTLNTWIKNFKTDEEKFFCACILDALIYRSNAQTNSLIYDLLNRTLVNLLNLNNIEYPKSFPDCFNGSIDPKIRFVANVHQKHAPTKSTHEILRFMRRDFNIDERWIIKPWEIQNARTDINAFIFIDDFLGSGDQFKEVITFENLKDLISDNKVIYAPLVAHINGFNSLSIEYPNLKIAFVELLSEKHCFFNNYFNSDGNTPEKAREFYSQLIREREITTNPFGYGELEIVYSFEHSCPDNSLPILHYNCDKWSRLLNR